MNRTAIVTLLVLLGFAALQAQQTNAPVDFTKARQLFERRQRGETLASDERAYLERALSERRKQQGRSAPQRPAPERLTPLTDMTANDRYEGEDGGLYGGGRNTPPDQHCQAAQAELAKIRPLNAESEVDEIRFESPLLFATISGVHLYGFPSPDSDYTRVDDCPSAAPNSGPGTALCGSHPTSFL